MKNQNEVPFYTEQEAAANAWQGADGIGFMAGCGLLTLAVGVVVFALIAAALLHI